MSIIQFAKNVKSFSKQDVIKSLSETKLFLETTGDALRELKANNIKLEDLFDNVGLERMAKRIVINTPRNFSLLDLHLMTANSGVLIISACIEELKKGRDNIIDGATLSIKQANILMISSYFDLWTDYLNRLLGYSIVKDKSKIRIVKDDINFFNANEDIFVDVTKTVYNAPATVIKRLQSLPDLLVEQGTVDILESTKGKESVLAMPVVGIGVHNYTPIYYFKVARLEFDIWRIKLHKQRIESNSMKILQLQNDLLGEPNPQIEHAISVYEDLINKSQDRIESIQRRYDYVE